MVDKLGHDKQLLIGTRANVENDAQKRRNFISLFGDKYLKISIVYVYCMEISQIIANKISMTYFCLHA